MYVNTSYTINWKNYEFINILGAGYRTGSALIYVPDVIYAKEEGHMGDISDSYWSVYSCFSSTADATYYRCVFCFSSMTDIKLVRIDDGYYGWNTTQRSVIITGLN